MSITSDHGNIEDDTSTHSVNDVLTTVIRADISHGNPSAGVAIPVFQARLFDIAPTVLGLLGLTLPDSDGAGDSDSQPVQPAAENTSATRKLGTDADRFVGRPLTVNG